MGIYGHRFDSLIENRILHESNIQNENRKIISEILNKIFNIAVKKMYILKKKYKVPYIAESTKPTLPKESEYYELEDENNDYFGEIVLLKIDTNKVFKLYDPDKVDGTSMDEWEDIISELVKEINSDKTINSYGKAYVEQPDDGGQIMFKIKKSLLKINTSTVSSSKKYSEIILANSEKYKDFCQKLVEEFNKFFKSTKCNSNFNIKYTDVRAPYFNDIRQFDPTITIEPKNQDTNNSKEIQTLEKTFNDKMKNEATVKIAKIPMNNNIIFWYATIKPSAEYFVNKINNII